MGFIKENSDLKEYPLPGIRNMKVHGRTTGNLSPLTLFWTGSGIEFNARGSELPNTTNETMCSRYHPGRLAHEKAAKGLAGFIGGLLPREST